MYDSDLAKILPEWSSWPKSKRDKVFEEYQNFSFEESNQSKFDDYCKEADAIDRERFIKLVPICLDARNYIGLLPLLQANWDEKDEECQEALSKELWDTAASSFVNALDVRDAMFHLQLLQLILPISMYHGRAIRVLRKSKKFVPWLEFCLTENTFLSAPPIQHSVMVLLRYAVLGCKKRFLDELIEAKVPTIVFSKIQKCCPTMIAPLSGAMEALVIATSQHYSQKDFKENRRLSIIFQVGNQQVCNRALEFDFTKEGFLGYMKMETWTDVGDIALGFTDVLLAMQGFLRIPTPMPVRQHLSVFGQSYSDVEPTDPVERSRWSNRYFCMRIGEADFSSDQGQMEGSTMKETIILKGTVLEQRRATSIQCGMCRKEEPEEGSGGQLFSKCGRCKMVLYCSRECQAKHWKTHKKVCSKPAKESLPEPLLNLDESINRSHSKLEGRTMYPVVFGVWLFHHYAS